MASNVKLTEMSTLTVNEIVDSLSHSYSAIINKGLELKTFPSVMLWGQPGTGKSQAVRQIAKRIEEETGKKTVVTDVRLLLFNPIDLRGIPVANEDRTLAIWLKPKIFQMDPSSKVVNILFLDEISAAPQSVQAAAYQITLDRVVGEHKLPDNCIVIAAGNRVTDKAVAYKMPKPLANRFLHFDVTTDFDAWKSWALRSSIHPMVLGFLSFRPDLLNTFDSTNDSLAFATPRSWEMVSNILSEVSDDMKDVYHLVSGLVGSGVASELKAWNKLYTKLPKVEDIFSGKARNVPEDPSLIFALTCSMMNYAKAHLGDTKGIANSIRYAYGFPKDFSILLIQEYLSMDDNVARELLMIPEFSKYLSDVSKTMNGSTNGFFNKR